MTMGVATITPDASIEKCADVMEDKKIRRVVVINDDGKVVGMVAQADIAEYGSNPSLIGNVVNEISDAPASPNRGVYNRMRGNQSYSSNRMPQPSPNRSHRFSGGDYESHTYRSNRSTRKEKSSFGISSLLPLLAGVGISFAAKYYLGSNEKPHRRRIAPRPTNDVSTGLPHSTDTSVSVKLPARPAQSVRLICRARLPLPVRPALQVRPERPVRSARRVQPAVRGAAISEIKRAADQPTWTLSAAAISNLPAVMI
jgi:hypothetical protein